MKPAGVFSRYAYRYPCRTEASNSDQLSCGHIVRSFASVVGVGRLLTPGPLDSTIAVLMAPALLGPAVTTSRRELPPVVIPGTRRILPLGAAELLAAAFSFVLEASDRESSGGGLDLGGGMLRCEKHECSTIMFSRRVVDSELGHQVGRDRGSVSLLKVARATPSQATLSRQNRGTSFDRQRGKIPSFLLGKFSALSSQPSLSCSSDQHQVETPP